VVKVQQFRVNVALVLPHKLDLEMIVAIHHQGLHFIVKRGKAADWMMQQLKELDRQSKLYAASMQQDE
jgi:hypothetical protein